MQAAGIRNPPAERDPTPTDANHGAPRLRTVTGNRFPRKCSCGCGCETRQDRMTLYFAHFTRSQSCSA